MISRLATFAAGFAAAVTAASTRDEASLDDR